MRASAHTHTQHTTKCTLAKRSARIPARARKQTHKEPRACKQPGWLQSSARSIRLLVPCALRTFRFTCLSKSSSYLFAGGRFFATYSLCCRPRSGTPTSRSLSMPSMTSGLLCLGLIGSRSQSKWERFLALPSRGRTLYVAGWERPVRAARSRQPCTPAEVRPLVFVPVHVAQKLWRKKQKAEKNVLAEDTEKCLSRRGPKSRRSLSPVWPCLCV